MTDNSGGTAYSALYTYIAKSPFIGQITFQQGATTRMTTTKQYDLLNRLAQISSAPSVSSPLSFGYSYNNANQRIVSRLPDGGYWRYQHDSLGQVTGGHKFFADETPVPGQQFDYAFDTIGNRTQTKAGGDAAGANQRSANYYANILNEYNNRDVPGAVDIMGVSFTTNAVTVNSQAAWRKGEYFRQQLSVGNASSAQWTNVTVSATGQSSQSGTIRGGRDLGGAGVMSSDPVVFREILKADSTSSTETILSGREFRGSSRFTSASASPTMPDKIRLAPHCARSSELGGLRSKAKLSFLSIRYPIWSTVALRNPLSTRKWRAMEGTSPPFVSATTHKYQNVRLAR